MKVVAVPVVAIIAPFRAKHWWQRWRNIRQAQVRALEVWELGACAYLPHCMAGWLWGVIPEEVIGPGLLELCRRCDTGILVEGWEASINSCIEKAALEKQGKPVFMPGERGLDDLRAWLSYT